MLHTLGSVQVVLSQIGDEVPSHVERTGCLSVLVLLRKRFILNPDGARMARSPMSAEMEGMNILYRH